MDYEPQAEPMRRVLMGTYESVLGDNKCVYFSTPITTGRLFFSWLAANPLANRPRPEWSDALTEKFAAEVVARNCVAAKTVAGRLRRAIDGIVIDPSAIPNIPTWDQKDWLLLWSSVILRYAHTVVFADGWQYSDGCADEFCVACVNGLNTRTESDMPLGVADGIDLLQLAVADIQRRGHSVAKLEHAIHTLSDFTRSV